MASSALSLNHSSIAISPRPYHLRTLPRLAISIRWSRYASGRRPKFDAIDQIACSMFWTRTWSVFTSGPLVLVGVLKPLRKAMSAVFSSVDKLVLSWSPHEYASHSALKAAPNEAVAASESKAFKRARSTSRVSPRGRTVVRSAHARRSVRPAELASARAIGLFGRELALLRIARRAFPTFPGTFAAA